MRGSQVMCHVAQEGDGSGEPGDDRLLLCGPRWLPRPHRMSQCYTEPNG